MKKTRFSELHFIYQLLKFNLRVETLPNKSSIAMCDLSIAASWFKSSARAFTVQVYRNTCSQHEYSKL